MPSKKPTAAAQRKIAAPKGFAAPYGQKQSPLAVQVGGDHYKNTAIQPVEFSAANKLNALEGSIAKRITRWRSKGGIVDLMKIKHEVDLLIATELKYPREGAMNGDYHGDLKVKLNDPSLEQFYSQATGL